MKDSIDKFLANWKATAKDYYVKSLFDYVQMKREWKVLQESFIEKWGCSIAVGLLSQEKKEELKIDREALKVPSKKFEAFRSVSEMNILSNMYYEKYRVVESSHNKAVALLEKILNKEVDKKKKSFITKVEKKAGKFDSTALLKIGHDGSINGFVHGSIKTVEVSTIYAGGYNIQCLHYRVLVK